MVHIRIEAPIRPTEDPDRIEGAVKAIFPDARIDRSERWITATSKAIDTLIKKAGEERVLDAARGALWRGRLDERSTRFEINKQAASMGRVNFNEVTHPLGDLIVTLEVDDLNELLDRISPPTGAEIRAREGTAAMRAAVHLEESALEEMGKDVDAGFDEEVWTEGEWDEDDDEDDEDEDYDPLGRRTGNVEEEEEGYRAPEKGKKREEG